VNANQQDDDIEMSSDCEAIGTASCNHTADGQWFRRQRCVWQADPDSRFGSQKKGKPTQKMATTTTSPPTIRSPRLVALI